MLRTGGSTPCSPIVPIYPGDTSDNPFVIIDSYCCSDDDDDADSSRTQTPSRTITPPLIVIEDDNNEDIDDIRKDIYDCRPGEPIGITHHIRQIHYHSRETELERIYRDIRLGLVARTDPRQYYSSVRRKHKRAVKRRLSYLRHYSTYFKSLSSKNFRKLFPNNKIEIHPRPDHKLHQLFPL